MALLKIQQYQNLKTTFGIPKELLMFNLIAFLYFVKFIRWPLLLTNFVNFEYNYLFN